MDESLINRVLDGLEERRKRVINGGINSIPSPFIRFSEDFLGVEQGKYSVGLDILSRITFALGAHLELIENDI